MQSMNLELTLIMPELIIASAICLLILVNSFLTSEKRYTGLIIGSITMAACALISMVFLIETTNSSIFNNHYRIDPLSTGLKFTTYLISLFIFIATKTNKENTKSELVLLELFAILGVSILASSNNLLTLYLGLETLTLSMYGLVASKRSSEIATESAMKFFILGAIASAIFLYGVSFIYGLHGTLFFDQFNNETINNSIEMQLALAFIICGIAFKFGAVPFHSWVPDTYQGASTSSALFISTIPKLGAFALIYRLLYEAFIANVEFWSLLILLLGLLSLILGNIIAIAQDNLRRILGYSAVGHIGFILIGLSIGSIDGAIAALAYLVIYILMTATAFMSIEVISTEKRAVVTLTDIKDLNSTHPWISLIMLFSMFSMIGIPPFIGFYAKWIILSELINSDMLVIALIGIIVSVIAAYYYLRIVWYMYFEKSELPIMKGSPNIFQKTSISLMGLSILLLGLYPSPIINFCRSIIPPFLLID